MGGVVTKKLFRRYKLYRDRIELREVREMKKTKCSYCHGEGWIQVAQEEALEQFLSQFLRLRVEPSKVEQATCPKCNGTGFEVEVELKDLCRLPSGNQMMMRNKYRLAARDTV